MPQIQYLFYVKIFIYVKFHIIIPKGRNHIFNKIIVAKLFDKIYDISIIKMLS